MPFNQHDIYTSSGSVQLFNEWTPYVSKFDTSSFYNWEQDNLPLYDLEERTYELWEQNGYNTSAGVPGLGLTVSADAATTTDGQAAMLANRNIFTDVSSCIAAIPKVVRFPVLVEIANFGDLGKLELHNFRIEEGGSIEIINRNFGRVYNASGTSKSVVSAPSYNQTHALVTTISSIDLSSTYTDTSCVHLSGAVLSSVADARAATNGYSVLYPKHSLREAPLTVAFAAATPLTTAPNEFSFPPYETIANSSDLTRDGVDISATNQATGGALKRNSLGATEYNVLGGNTYFNKCSHISVKNCDGPIYIRNFFVDGNLEQDIAINITNSDVLLENCAGVRAKEAGFKFNNSKVTLSRSAAAYRNYKLTSTTEREAEVGYGFHAVNSEVLVSSLPTTLNTYSPGDTGASAVDCVVMASRNYAGWVLDNSKLRGGIQRRLATNPVTASILGAELNTGYGFLLDNSKVDLKGLVDVYGNDKGIQADNSKFIFENLCVDAQSNEAIRCRNSEFIFDSPTAPTNSGQSDRKQLDMSANGQHIDLQSNSVFGFRRKNNLPQKYGNSKFAVAHGVIKWGGANKSSLPAISVNDGSIVDLINPWINVSGTAESVVNTPSYGRAVKATNSSKVSLFGTKTGCTYVIGPPGRTYQQKMAGIYGSNNSTINLHGPTAIAQFGVDVLVEDNSVLNIEPARKRDEFGLEVSGFDLSSGENHTAVELHAIRACLVANKNSTINMTDLGSYPANWIRATFGNGYLDAGTDYPTITFDTSSYTSSGCLQFYPNPQDTTAIDELNLDDIAVASPAGHGFGTNEFPVFTQKTGVLRFFNTNNIVDTELVNTQVDNLTQGGVCLRATEDSVVNVKNVHFPAPVNDSPLDGHYYTTSGDLCSKLMIWNIADTSRLNASYLSVSGMHPADTQFHGPSAIWASSRDGVNGGVLYDVPASGAPLGTPGTGNLSILDAFGAGSSVWVVPSGVDVNSSLNRSYIFSGGPTALNNQTASAMAHFGLNVSGDATYKFGAGPHASKNQGIFRIYWTPKSSARALQTDLSGYLKGSPLQHAGDGPISGVVGPAYQIFSQGYNCSADLSALVPNGELNASGDFPDLLRLSYDSDSDGIPDQLWTSGFYYCADMLDENPTQCILDESAAKAFANSQNASVNIGNTPRKVTLVRARSDSASNRLSESYVGDTSGSLGFKSAAIFDLSRDN